MVGSQTGRFVVSNALSSLPAQTRPPVRNDLRLAAAMTSSASAE